MAKLQTFNKKGFGVFDSIQVIYRNKNERYDGRRADLVDVIIYIRGVSRYLEEKYSGGFKSRKFGLKMVK